MEADPDLHWKALLRSYRPTKPIIAAVEGVAIAGGTEILQATEIRVAGESARFGVSRGALVALSDGGLGGAAARARSPTRTPPRSCSPASTSPRARRSAIGLVGHVVPDGQALAEGARDRRGDLRERAARRRGDHAHAARDPTAWSSRRCARVGVRQAVFASEDAREGPRAFKEKRKPTSSAAVFRRAPSRRRPDEGSRPYGGHGFGGWPPPNPCLAVARGCRPRSRGGARSARGRRLCASEGGRSGRVRRCPCTRGGSAARR